MQDQKTATLETVFSDVLQNLAFLFSDEDDEFAAPGTEWLETRITFAGAHQGTVRLRCPRAFPVLLAANLLGIDPQAEEAETQAYDAVREFMNVLCGQLINSLHGTEEMFDLTIPVIHELEETPDLSEIEDGKAASFNVQGHRLQVIYHPEA